MASGSVFQPGSVISVILLCLRHSHYAWGHAGFPQPNRRAPEEDAHTAIYAIMSTGEGKALSTKSRAQRTSQRRDSCHRAPHEIIGGIDYS